MSIIEAYHNYRLYGHALTALHDQFADFMRAPLSWVVPRDPDEYEYFDESCWGRVVRHNPDSRSGYTFYRETALEMTLFNPFVDYILKPLVELAEWVARRVLGLVVTVLATATVAPLGLGFKIIDLYVHKDDVYLRIDIWNKSHLYGHRLAAAPAELWNKITAPLSWHLRKNGDSRANGLDRRATVFIACNYYFQRDVKDACLKKISKEGVRWIEFVGPSGGEPPSAPTQDVWLEPEYPYVPFELFECAYRIVVLAPCLVAATALSPLGFVAKCVDLACRTCVDLVGRTE